jgi:hypothetical protein
MHFVWIAWLAATAKPEPVMFVVRENDPTSLAAPSAIAAAAPPGRTFVMPSHEEAVKMGRRLHLTAYSPETAQVKSLRDAAADLLEKAKAIPTVENFQLALTAALALPVESRGFRLTMILNVERQLAISLVKRDQSAEMLLLDIGFRRGFADEDFTLLVDGKKNLPLARRLNDNYQRAVGNSKAKRLAAIKIVMTPQAPFELSSDSSEFSAEIAPHFFPGTHEFLARIGGQLGLIHNLDVRPQNPQEEVEKLVLNSDIERGLLFTPDGFLVRAGQAFTPEMAAFVTSGSVATRVWLVEALRDSPPHVRVTVSDGRTKLSAVVPLRSAELLQPTTLAARQALGEALLAAAQAAETAGVAALVHYDVTRAPSGDFALVAAEHVPLYKNRWLWAAVGAVVIAGAATAVILATRDFGVTLQPLRTSN